MKIQTLERAYEQYEKIKWHGEYVAVLREMIDYMRNTSFDSDHYLLIKASIRGLPEKLPAYKNHDGRSNIERHGEASKVYATVGDKRLKMTPMGEELIKAHIAAYENEIARREKSIEELLAEIEAMG